MSETVYTHVASDETLKRVKNALAGTPTGPIESEGYTHVASEETLVEIAEMIEARLGLIWDSDHDCYTNESVHALVSSWRDGMAYGVSIPKGSTTECTKTGAHEAVAAPTPGYVGRAAVDPYTHLGPFRHSEVNGFVDEDGTPHVTAIEGDGHFKRDGSNGDVWILTPVLYWLIDETDNDSVEISISDTMLTGMAAQPQAYLPDGSLRPYMLYAKYPGVKGADGYMHSYSGLPTWNRNVSHDSLRTQCRTASSGYSGKSIADDWYVKIVAWLMKYAGKHSQGVYAGCINYNLNYAVTVAETGKTRVIIAKANAANLVVGSSVTLGSSDHSNSVLDGTRILSIEDYDADNSAVNLDTTTTFDTTTSLKLSTAPWHSGSLDSVEGDGTITSAGASSGKEPFKLQGIELGVGVWEVIGDVIMYSDGTRGWEPCVNYDSRNEATSVTSDYTHTGKYFYSDTADGWKYPLYPSNAGGLIYGAGSGGSISTGMCDGQYTLKTETSGSKELLGLGGLRDTGFAGLFAGNADVALTNALWGIGSRISGTGRGRAEA